MLKESDANRVVEITDELEALSAERELHTGGLQASSSSWSRSFGIKHRCVPDELLRDVVRLARSSRSLAGGGAPRREAGLGGAVSFLATALLQERARQVTVWGAMSDLLGLYGVYTAGVNLTFTLSALLRCQHTAHMVKQQEVVLNEKSEEFEQLALALHR